MKLKLKYMYMYLSKYQDNLWVYSVQICHFVKFSVQLKKFPLAELMQLLHIMMVLRFYEWFKHETQKLYNFTHFMISCLWLLWKDHGVKIICYT